MNKSVSTSPVSAVPVYRTSALVNGVPPIAPEPVPENWYVIGDALACCAVKPTRARASPTLAKIDLIRAPQCAAEQAGCHYCSALPSPARRRPGGREITVRQGITPMSAPVRRGPLGVHGAVSGDRS